MHLTIQWCNGTLSIFKYRYIDKCNDQDSLDKKEAFSVFLKWYKYRANSQLYYKSYGVNKPLSASEKLNWSMSTHLKAPKAGKHTFQYFIIFS